MIYSRILVFVMDWLQDLPGIPQIEANPITYTYILDAYTCRIYIPAIIIYLLHEIAREDLINAIWLLHCD